MRNKKAPVVTAFLCMTTMCWATNYYAAPGATGDGKSISTPGDLNELASKTIQGGDSLFLLDGVYYVTKTVDVKTAPGTADKMTFVGAYRDAHPIIDGYRMAYNNNGQSNCVRTRVNYVHLYGITARYAGFKGFLIGGNYNKIECCVAHHCVDTGIQIKNAVGCTVINCDSHDNFDYEQGGLSSPDFGGNADGFCDKQFSGDGNTYINCRAWNNSDDGWDLYKRNTSSPIVLINCIAYANSPEYYDFTGNPRLETDKEWFDQIEGKTATTTKGYTDTWYRTHYYNNGNKNGFKIGGSGVATDVTMYRCLAIANTVKGFDQNYTQGDVKLYNCTGCDNGSNFNFSTSELKNLDIKNSISYYGERQGADVISCCNYTHSSNSWDMAGMTPTAADFDSTDPTEALSERNADGTLNIPTLMCLAASSRLIDAGEVIPGYTDYLGSKPDLGWREHEVVSAIDEEVTSLNGARRLNIYTLRGDLMGMVSNGDINALNLPPGIYVVKDFDTNRAIKIRR